MRDMKIGREGNSERQMYLNRVSFLCIISLYLNLRKT